MVDKYVEQPGAHAAVIGQLDADRLATARPLPEINCEAEAAPDVEQRARLAVGDHQQRTDRFPDSAACLDVEAPELVTILVEIAGSRGCRADHEKPLAQASAAHQREHRVWRRQSGDRKDRNMRAGVATDGAPDA